MTWVLTDVGLEEHWAYGIEIEREDLSGPKVVVFARDSVLGGLTNHMSDADARAEADRLARLIREHLEGGDE